MPLRTLALRASIWTVLQMGGERLLRLASNLVLTRLLFPEAFGLMALVFVFLQGMQMLSDLGIGPSIIQSERGDDRRLLNTAWTLQIARGLLIFIAISAAAWPVSAIYAEPQLAPLLVAVGVTAVIAGFNSTARYTVSRHLALGRMAVFDLASQGFAIVVMVVWAALTPTVWVLAGGAVVAAVGRMLLSHRLIPGQTDRLEWDPDAARAIIKFGKWIFVTSAVGFLAAQIDRLMLGKLVPMEVLGVYSIAFMLCSLPEQLVSQIALKVIFPATSQRAHLPRADLRRLIAGNRLVMLLGLAVIVALLCAFGDLLVMLLYDRRYHDASWMLAILALGLWPRMLTNTLGASLLGIGQPRYLALSGLTRFILLAAAIPLAYSAYGIAGVVVIVALGALSDYVVESYGLWRHNLLLLRQDAGMTIVWLALTAGLLAVRAACGMSLPFNPTS